ncbi:MAG: DUF3603 family protein [Tenericutes bacterium]|nr:DUF3603 family protein [Mycoplasmatota bacterium]
MIYIYDILLNWCDINNVYDFYEWDLNDNLEHIKKINLIKVDNNTIDDFINHEIKVNQNLLEAINSKCEVYTQDNLVFLKYAAIFTDCNRVIAIEFDKNGISIFKSKMLIDEETEIIDISCRINEIKIDYKIMKKISKEDFLTRLELKIKNCLIKEFKDIYTKKNYQKLKYFYHEYSNDNFEEDINIIYKKLINSLDKLNNNHYKIYNIIRMLYTKKKV